jgi:hypothetical protein
MILLFYQGAGNLRCTVESLVSRDFLKNRDKITVDDGWSLKEGTREAV